ncbi:hypothetical protein HEQ60_09735 [Haematospirillum sp. H1815]|uniref:hypothetical protein n=1 Tax=Haematospirillum sp. H1815 TaxID=2723108 RepID=UPI00143AEC6A|nr:hypothetical protein [Haematospirillum sp. H1815]NKD78037.1 hypothetical protein [Haematospirillum sp. H1815]
MYSLSESPFFADGAVWSAEGQYVEEKGIVLPAHGSWRVRHRRLRQKDRSADDESLDTPSLSSSRLVWYIEADLRLITAQGDFGAMRGVISVDPPTEKRPRDAWWEWSSPGIGTLGGRYTRVGDTIISQGATDDGVHVLTECFLISESGAVGIVRGVLSRDGETIASWGLTLSLE